jgi:hypothetical protein
MAFTKDEAIVKLKEWAEWLDVNTDTADFAEAVETLVKPVMSERLDFDADKEIFRLKLASPIVMEKGNRELLEIRELTLDDKRSVQRYKDNEKIDMVEAIYAKAAGISLAEASKLKGRDFSVITAINQVFFS